MQKLEKEVEAKEREVLRNKEEIHNLKNAIFKEKAKSDAAANILAKKTKSMTEQVNILNDRCQRVSLIFCLSRHFHDSFKPGREEESGRNRRL